MPAQGSQAACRAARDQHGGVRRRILRGHRAQAVDFRCQFSQTAQLGQRFHHLRLRGHEPEAQAFLRPGLGQCQARLAQGALRILFTQQHFGQAFMAPHHTRDVADLGGQRQDLFKTAPRHSRFAGLELRPGQIVQQPGPPEARRHVAQRAQRSLVVGLGLFALGADPTRQRPHRAQGVGLQRGVGQARGALIDPLERRPGFVHRVALDLHHGFVHLQRTKQLFIAHRPGFVARQGLGVVELSHLHRPRL